MLSLLVSLLMVAGAWGVSPAFPFAPVLMRLAPNYVTIPAGVVINDADLRGPAAGPAGSALVGAFSGLAYDVERKVYYITSEDDENPRMFTVRMEQNAHGISSVQVLDATPLRNVFGDQFSDGVSDPQDIEYASLVPDAFYWASDSQKADGEGGKECLPLLSEADLATGALRRTFPMPSSWDNDGSRPQASGVRCGRGLEGIALSRDQKTLLGCLESPLVQDPNPLPATQASHSCMLWDRETGTLLAEYIYPSGPAPHGFQVVGLPTVMTVDKERYASVEISQNAHGLFRMDIYVFTLQQASNIFFDRGTVIPPNTFNIQKKLFYSITDGQIPGFRVVDYQGMAVGPTLEDGSRAAVILISDNSRRPKAAGESLIVQFNIE